MMLLLQWISSAVDRLPQPIITLIGNLIGDAWFFAIRVRRKTVVRNLQESLGLGPEESKRLARSNYRHYGQSFMETLRSYSWSAEDYKKLELEGKQHIDPYLEKGQGAFLLCCHYGSWEVGAAALVAKGIPLDIVVKRAASPFFENLLCKMRKRKGLGIIIEEGTAKDILSSLSKGRVIGFMLDQFMGPPIGIPSRFLGREAGTPAALALLTEKRPYPVFPAYSRRIDGKLKLIIESAIVYGPLSDDKSQRIYSKTETYNQALEKIIRTAPEQWLWLHRRWKAFKGTPKWQIAAQAIVSAILMGCASQQSITDTIQLPPEPTIAVPNFQKIDRIEVTEFGSKTVHSTPPAPKQKTKIKKKKEEEKPLTMFKSSALPFDIGEQTVLKLRWMMVPAGNATLEVHEGDPMMDRPTLKFKGRARTNSFVDKIYRVDNRSVSLVDKEALIPYQFDLIMDETHQNKLTRVRFDHVKNIVHYQAERKSPKWGDQKEDRQDSAKPFVKDLFTALFFVRTLSFALGRTETFYLYENGKTFEVRLTPVGNEFVNVEAGAFQCWKIKVELALDNVLAPTGDIYMWLSDDFKKYIVKFDAKIKIGSLNGELISIRDKPK